MRGVILDGASMGAGISLGPILATLDEWEVHRRSHRDQVAARIAEAQVVVSNKVRIEASDMDAAPHLRLIAVLATGTNNVDLQAAAQRGITVCNAVGYAAASVVQHTVGLMLALATNLNAYLQDVRDGLWQQSPSFCLSHHPIIELSGKCLGIVGHGTLGAGVARVARSLGMEVVLYRRPGTPDGPDRLAPDAFWGAVDLVSLHCPLTAENRHLINRQVLERMRPGALLVNTARGGLVDSPALIEALRSGRLGGAAIDVLDTEPPTLDEPLIACRLPNLLVTPHNAWCTFEARSRLVQQVRENILAFLAGSPRNRVV